LKLTRGPPLAVVVADVAVVVAVGVAPGKCCGCGVILTGIEAVVVAVLMLYDIVDRFSLIFTWLGKMIKLQFLAFCSVE